MGGQWADRFGKQSPLNLLVIKYPTDDTTDKHIDGQNTLW